MRSSLALATALVMPLVDIRRRLCDERRRQLLGRRPIALRKGNDEFARRRRHLPGFSFHPASVVRRELDAEIGLPVQAIDGLEQTRPHSGWHGDKGEATGATVVR